MFHILVVEDDQALNKLICRVLNKNGYTGIIRSGGSRRKNRGSYAGGRSFV